MNKKLHAPDGGFSLIEVMIVLVIIAILVVFSIARFNDSADYFQIRNMATELKANLERARFDSVKRRPTTVNNMSTVVINSTNSISVSVDLDQNGTIDSYDTRVIDLNVSGNLKIVGAALAFPVTVSFNRLGHTITTDSFGNTILPTFVVCDGCTVGTANFDNSFVVSVSSIGTVSMYRTGETVATLTNPTVTNVGTATDIDPIVAVVPNAPAPTGTPAPTP